ncbi:MAG: hypothetical protein P8Y06_02205, partial [Patescibacteria group bacterium]
FGILTLITIVLWIAFGAYRSITSETPPKVAAGILEPLSPNLDTDTLGEISSRLFFQEQDLPETIISTPEATPSPSPTPEAEETTGEEETATESATTEEATESGELTQ